MIINLLFSLLISCAEDEFIEYTSCNIHLQEEVTLQPSTTQNLSVSPVSNTWDTQVLIDSQETDIISVTRNACGACDECRIAEDCDSCETCTACDALCDPNVCEESISIAVPELNQTSVQLQIINLYGYSPIYTLNVDTSEN